MKIKNFTKMCVFESGLNGDFNLSTFGGALKKLPSPGKGEFYKLQVFKVKKLMSWAFASFIYGVAIRFYLG